MKHARKYLTFVLLVFIAASAILLLNLSSCGANEPNGTALPATAVNDPPLPATRTPEYKTFLPADEQIAQISAGVQENEPSPAETGHVQPPSDRVDALEAICQALSDPAAGGLLNPECNFNRAWATSYTLPDAGVVYQILSLAAETEGTAADVWLEQVGGWEYPLAIGGLLIYQQADFAQFTLLPGVYLALLQNDLTFQLYNENNELAAAGSWQLRRLDGRAPAPVALVTPNQLCYARLVLQACFNLVSPGFGADGQNAEIIDTTVAALQAAGWLPPDVTIHRADALASIEGGAKGRDCTNALAEGEYQSQACLPSLVAAAAEPISDTVTLAKITVAAKSVFPSLQATGAISEVITGIGVLEVLETLAGEVFDDEGQVADLVTGSYRVDLLGLSDGSYLFQLVSAQDSVLYLAAVPAPGVGELVAAPDDALAPSGDIIEPETSGVLLDALLWKVCRPYGWGSVCNSAPLRKWAYWCASFVKSGWCNANGTFQ